MVRLVPEKKLKTYYHMRRLALFDDFADVGFDEPTEVVWQTVTLDEQRQMQDVSKEYNYIVVQKGEVSENYEVLAEDGNDVLVRYVKKQRTWKDGEKHGLTIVRNRDGSTKYTVLYEHNKVKYAIPFNHGQKHGLGVHFLADGKKCYERWKNGVLIKGDTDIRKAWAAQKKTR